VPLEQEQPQAWAGRVGAPGKALEPSVEGTGTAGGVIDDDERRHVLGPLGRALRLNEALEVAAVEEAGLPAARRRLLAQLDGEPGLAAAGPADDAAREHGPGIIEPSAERGGFGLAAEEAEKPGLGPEQVEVGAGLALAGVLRLEVEDDAAAGDGGGVLVARDLDGDVAAAILADVLHDNRVSRLLPCREPTLWVWPSKGGKP
jgi:hypothetical protein